MMRKNLTMNRKLAVGHLWWKELRQLLPLIGLLFVVGLLLQLLTLATSSEFDWRSVAVVLGMPGLFAAGAGALLVGQEKELRTLDWLHSLPVIPQDVLRTKLLVGLLGLVVIWLVSLAFAATAGLVPSRLAESGGEWLWALHSLFLLLLGFATAWQLRSSLVSLLLVLPLACVPLVLANVHENFLHENVWRSNEPRPWIMALYLVLGCAAALVWGWRAALRYFSPERSLSAASKYFSLKAQASFTRYARSTPAPALLWQFSSQNRAALLGIAALLFVPWIGLLLLTRTTTFHGKPPATWSELWAAMSLLGSFLAVSWLGLLVFQGDTLQRRKQFLADRGVSPGLTWMTRIAVPLLMLAIVVLVSSMVLQGEAKIIPGFNLWLTGAAAVFAIFASALWVGQVVRSSIVGAILAPFVSLLVVGFLYFSIGELGAPWWTVGLSLLIPLVATLLATSAWMDNRTGWRFWSWHVGMLVLAVLLPSVGFLSYMAMYPRMSAASREELQRLVSSQRPGMSWDSINMTFSNRGQTGPVDSSSKQSFETIAEYRQFSIANLRYQMASSSTGLADWWTLKVVLADVIMQRMADSSAADVPQNERYRESLELLFELTKRQRMSLDLRNQDVADQLELSLLRELQMPRASERMGEELSQSLQLMLGDQTQRDDARRAALASSWQRSQNGSSSGSQKYRTTNALGSYHLQVQQYGRVTVREVWESSRKAGLVSERLLMLLDATSDQQRAELRTEISEILGFPPSATASNAIYQETEQGQRLLTGELNYPQVPGQLWHGDWEQVAKSISEGE